MSRSSVIIERTMRQEGFVSASVVSSQYGITRAQLLDAVLQGKIKPQKPDSSSMFYCSWKDCLAFFGTPAEYRSRSTKSSVLPEEDLPEVLLDGMIPVPELEEMYRREAAEKAAARRAAKQAAGGATQNSEKPRVVIKPAEFDK